MAGLPIRKRASALERSSARRALARSLEAALYVVWIGSLVGIAFIAAPAAFAHAPAQDAGAIVGASLRAWTVVGWVCGGMLLVIWLVRIPADGGRAVVGALLVALALGTSDYARGSVAPRMDAIVSEIHGSISALPATDPRRRTFDALHRESTQLYGVVLVCGFLAAGLSAWRR